MRKLINDAYLARKAGRTAAERIAFVRTLIRLRLGRHRAAKRGAECRARMLGYDVTGYSGATLDFLFREVFLSGEYRFETPEPRPLIVDCGSNIGVSVLYFKHLFPEARVMAFEANPSAFALLRRNMEANAMRDVELHNVALAEREGEIAFFVSADPGTLVGSTRSDRGGAVELKAKAVRLSEFLRDQEHVDLVKIDVEGSETGIVNELIASGALPKPAQYIIEYHHRINGDRSALADFLGKFERAGYDYNLKAALKRPGEFQDVLVHCYREKRA